jgi:ADP-ribose pyrophosphatase YjhB (NUDIX family)
VWLSLAINRSDLLPVVTTQGFVFHHCIEEQITLVCRLKENAFVPPYATHTAGAGGIVVSPNNDILVVREVTETRKGFYKLPGGHLDCDEHIEKAVVREIFEETGIQTQFESLLCLGQVHRWQFARSNFYFVCRLKALDFEIAIDQVEIVEALWMPLDSFLSNKRVGTFDKQIVARSLSSQGLKVSRIEGIDFDDSRLEVYLP